MKKLFTIDDIAVAFVSALGYGFGETISRIFGWPEAVCGVVSFLLGMGLGGIISRIAFSREVQKSPRNRIITYSSVLVIFLFAQYISIRWMGVSMMDYVVEEVVYVVIFPVLGFIANLFIRGYQVRKTRRLYGDGSRGFVFNVKEKTIKEVNRGNHRISGRYCRKLAVKTRTGIYVGGKEKKFVYYLGIPYAKPPVGELRWKAPEPLPSSEEVFEAKYFGASAIQVDHEGSLLKKHRQNEDCLYLNVFLSAEKSESSKPVLVLFHNGDFSYGGSADPILYGNHFVEKHPEVLFVSFNYRLGIFGFIDFSKVPGGEAYPDTLNLGLLDQIAALKWIRENIGAFGGDPERITVLGFDSGATSICLLSAAEQAKGLFRKAFIFNGSLELIYDTREPSRALAEKLLKETKTASMEELLKLDTDVLKDAAQKLWQNICCPACDGELIPVDFNRAFEAIAASEIEFIVGFPSNQAQVFRSVIGNQNYEDYINTAAEEISGFVDAPIADAIKEYIEKQTEAASEIDAKSKLVEQWNALCIYRTAVKLNAGGNKVHLLYWNENPLIENLGSGTVDAAAALLGNSEALRMYGGLINEDLTEILQMLLKKYVNGEALKLYPNEIHGVDALDWKKFPKALLVSDGILQCDTITDKVTEIKELMDFAER